MKTIPGKIVITDKVYFEPDGLEKPKEEDYWDIDEYNCKRFNYHKYYLDGKAYKASKQLVEVENVYWWDESEVWTYTSRYYKEFDYKDVINNQPCKAEIKDNKATIIELIN